MFWGCSNPPPKPQPDWISFFVSIYLYGSQIFFVNSFFELLFIIDIFITCYDFFLLSIEIVLFLCVFEIFVIFYV